ncbi:MAG: tRNA glutamyl-Q(34) synthetase GluQRS [Pseudomonadota bacterium]
MTETHRYRGRFAPSPTGPLHFGSLVAAVGSWLDARHHHGAWLVRMEDLDPPREMHGTADAILRTLEAYGLEWDGSVEYQSRRSRHYEAALAQLAEDGHLYHCACTRREIADSAIGPDGSGIYPGTCRNGLPPGRQARAVRVRVYDTTIRVTDLLQGPLQQALAAEAGDFVLRRADGLYAYQLAVVVDDAAQAISHVVRGADLLRSTPRQVHLQRLLGYATPDYLHLPVAIDDRHEKLGKQTRAPALASARAVTTLLQVLEFLRQPLPEGARDASPGELLHWAAAHWNRQALPAERELTAPPAFQHAAPTGL